MRVALLTPEYVTPKSIDGGLANYIKKTVKALTLRGVEVCVFVISDRNLGWQDDGVTIYEVKCDNLWFRILYRIPYVGELSSVLQQIISSKKIAKKFWDIYRKVPFDIVHASSYMAPGYALLKNGKVPVVCRASSYTPLVRSAYGRKRNIAEYLSDWLEIRQVLDADGSFAPSEFVAKTFSRIEAFKPKVIRTPIDTQEIELDYSYFRTQGPQNPYFLFFGTLSKIKGLDLLGDVLPDICEKYRDLAFVFIGRDDGLPSGEMVFYYILSRCGNYKDRLYYFPSLPKSQLYPFIINAEVVLMPSRVDNYPNVCLEAQIFGKPVIGTYESSLNEMIIDGQTGFLAENDNAESLRKTIEKWLNITNEEKEAMKQKITSHIEVIKNEDRIGQLIDFYKETIKRFTAWHEKEHLE